MAREKKSEETRVRILDAAVGLFRERGFEAAPMREIASAAGVATGAAYYYFESKDAIVLAFYDRSQREMEPLVEAAIAERRDFEGRLRAMIEVKLNYFAPDRGLLRALAAHTDPAQPLSPFSAETREIRERDVQFFEKLLAGSRMKVPGDLGPLLPRMLWMYQMGLILFWIYDRSEGQSRTRKLVEKSAAVVSKLIRLSGFPLLRPARKAIVELVEVVAGSSAA
jgi:AcrR family transcriptional regulator